MTTHKGPDVSKRLFGGVLDIDGAGHYPGLELLNFLLCCPDGILPGPAVPTVRLLKRSHSFARRLVAGDLKLAPEVWEKVLLDEASRTAIVHLLRCVELSVPNAVKSKTWERTHFFPYTRSLVHWDARHRNDEFKLERRYLRGGGALAFSVLRMDPNAARLNAIRDGFAALYPENLESPLEKLAATLLLHGAQDDKPLVDALEGSSTVMNDELDDLYRDGIQSIVCQDKVATVLRIRAVMNWTGIWLVLLGFARSANLLGRERPLIIVDCAGTHPQLRRAAQRCLKESLASVEEAAWATVRADSPEDKISSQQMNKIKGFFGGTAALCGLLNAPKGRRHFTLKLNAIESLVLASGAQVERSFEDFNAEWLGRRCGLILGRASAAEFGLLRNFDATIFEENERQFAEQMRATGMLKVYSDATRMVSAEASQ